MRPLRPQQPTRAFRHLLICLLAFAALLAGCDLLPPPKHGQKLDDTCQVIHLLDGRSLGTLDPALMYFSSDYDKAQLIFPPTRHAR